MTLKLGGILIGNLSRTWTWTKNLTLKFDLNDLAKSQSQTAVSMETDFGSNLNNDKDDFNSRLSQKQAVVITSRFSNCFLVKKVVACQLKFYNSFSPPSALSCWQVVLWSSFSPYLLKYNNKPCDKYHATIPNIMVSLKVLFSSLLTTTVVLFRSICGTKKRATQLDEPKHFNFAHFYLNVLFCVILSQLTISSFFYHSLSSASLLFSSI